MRILAVNRYYRPDHSATSQMLTDLAEYLAEHGCLVTVITSRLAYEGGAPFAPKEKLGGVSIYRVWTTRFGRGNLVGRAVDYGSFYIASFLAMLWLGRKGDILIAKTDPPLISVVAAVAARMRGMVLVNWCQDLFPEVAQALGASWAGGWLGALLKAARNWSLRRAAFNAVLHEKMAEFLISAGIERGKIRVLPNWADKDVRPIPREQNALRKELGFGDAVVIGYSGNLGRAHIPEAVAALVHATRDEENLVWLFVGGGAGISLVKQASQGAKNVVFLPYQPRELLSQTLSAADVHLISLDPKCEGLIVPSKLYGVRAVGRPIIFLGDADGAVAREISRYGAGVALDPNSHGDWREKVHSISTRAENREAWRIGWNATVALRAWCGELCLIGKTRAQ